MAQEQPKQVSFQEYIGGLRNQIVLSYDGSKEIALKSFDDVTSKLIEYIQQVEALKQQKDAPEPVVPKVVKDKSRNKK